MITKLNFSAAPKGLGGRFLSANDTVRENDLINYNLFEGVRPGWKRNGNSGFTVGEKKIGWYFRPNEPYSIDQCSYYVSSQRNKDKEEPILDAEITEEIKEEKVKFIYDNLLKDDYETPVKI